MHFIYYSFAVLALMYEFSIMLSPGKLIEFKKNIKGKKGEEYTSQQKSFTLLATGYFVWGCIGFFTSQWLLFLAWLAMGLIPKRWKPVIAIDAFISVLIIIFIIINRYHLHYSMQQIIDFVIK